MPQVLIAIILQLSQEVWFREVLMKTEIRLGKWRHFKGGEYEVLGIAKHSETLEPMVVYRALYGEKEIWVRPLSMWNETVELDGKVYKRFTFSE